MSQDFLKIGKWHWYKSTALRKNPAPRILGPYRCIKLRSNTGFSLGLLTIHVPYSNARRTTNLGGVPEYSSVENPAFTSETNCRGICAFVGSAERVSRQVGREASAKNSRFCLHPHALLASSSLLVLWCVRSDDLTTSPSTYRSFQIGLPPFFLTTRLDYWVPWLKSRMYRVSNSHSPWANQDMVGWYLSPEFLLNKSMYTQSVIPCPGRVGCKSHGSLESRGFTP